MNWILRSKSYDSENSVSTKTLWEARKGSNIIHPAHITQKQTYKGRRKYILETHTPLMFQSRRQGINTFASETHLFSSASALRVGHYDFPRWRFLEGWRIRDKSLASFGESMSYLYVISRVLRTPSTDKVGVAVSRNAAAFAEWSTAHQITTFLSISLAEIHQFSDGQS